MDTWLAGLNKGLKRLKALGQVVFTFPKVLFTLSYLILIGIFPHLV